MHRRIGPAEAAAIVEPWAGNTPPAAYAEHAANARRELHRHIRANCGAVQMTYGTLQLRLQWRGRGAQMGRLLNAVRALDEADGLPASTSILRTIGSDRPASTSGWLAGDLAYHRRMVERCWQAYDDPR